MIASFSGQYRWLSNFAPVDVIYGDYVYPSVEHAYQAAKATDEDGRFYVSTAATPGEAKRRGRRIVLRTDWDDIKLQVMYDLVQQKFQQEPYREKLLATGDLLIVEGNTWGDTYWGCVNGVGHNHLGQIIMAVREELKVGLPREAQDRPQRSTAKVSVPAATSDNGQS